MAKIIRNKNNAGHKNRKIRGIGFLIGAVLFYILNIFFIKSDVPYLFFDTEPGYEVVNNIFCFGFVICLILAFVFLILFIAANVVGRKEWASDAAGERGERMTTNLLSMLPEGFTVFCNVVAENGERKSELDNVIVGPTGVFIVETKNRRGTIAGDCQEQRWIQSKLGCGGASYDSEFYNPVKQVGTHIYNLSHYLKNNKIYVYIHGAVIFVNPECSLRLENPVSDIPVFCAAEDGETGLLKYILDFGEKLSDRDINRVCEAIGKIS